MRITALICLNLLARICFGQVSTLAYLQENRQNLTQNSTLNIGEAKIIGFGALHGSAKTEDVEILLLQELVNNHGLKYYLPETDYSTAKYFQKYIEIGDERLLKELVNEYGTMVPQEKSVEVFNKWKSLRPLFQKNKVSVIGIDKIASYKFSVKELLSLIEANNVWKYHDSLKLLLENPKTTWSVFESQKTKSLLRNFVGDFETNKSTYFSFVRDTNSFNHIIKNIKYTYETYYREPFIYDNYVLMKQKYSLENSLHFARFGIFHLMKDKINNSSSFFSMLIGEQIFATTEVLTIQGFLTESSVLWNKYDRNGKQIHTSKNGYGIGDYWLEYFYKIKDLKKSKLSDITLFHLNKTNSPYLKQDELRLVKIKTLLSKSQWLPSKGKNTLDYIDCAILISNSNASRAIEELDE